MNNIARYYRILGVRPEATFSECKEAHRRLIKQWHPDLFDAEDPKRATAEEKSRKINYAFEQLKRHRFRTQLAQRSVYARRSWREQPARSRKRSNQSNQISSREFRQIARTTFGKRVDSTQVLEIESPKSSSSEISSSKLNDALNNMVVLIADGDVKVERLGPHGTHYYYSGEYPQNLSREMYYPNENSHRGLKQ